MQSLSRCEIVAGLERTGIVAIIRSQSPSQLVDVCRALADGGVTASEITMTTPGALDAIAATVDRLGPNGLIGVGSVLDAQTARTAILAGASYVVSPTTKRQVIEMAHRYGKAVIPGALTPTEILGAFEAGADLVKVFPANHFGPRYFQDLLAPMPQLRLTPTGGVDLETAADWLRAGAACLGVGSALVRKDLIMAGDLTGLTKLARRFVQIVKQVREES